MINFAKKNHAMKNTLFYLSLFLFIFSCKSSKNTYQTNKEAWEDKLKLEECYRYQNNVGLSVEALQETTPVKSEGLGSDAADDPAIWYNKNNPEKSLIIGTNKQFGLHLYDMQGEELQFLECGEMNNVDLREGFLFNGKEQILVAASNRTKRTVSLFFLCPDEKRISPIISDVYSSVGKVYGLCMYKNEDEFYVVVNSKKGFFEQWLIYTKNDKIKSTLIRKWNVESQPEGMVADDEAQILYLGVEEKGIYSLHLSNANSKKQSNLHLIPESTNGNNPLIKYDIEGLALISQGNAKYLVASIQGNFTYAIFDLMKKRKYVCSFKIMGENPDRVEETDGIEICNFPIGEKYPQGIMVAQDGFNYDSNGKLENQNFKFVSVKDILDQIK